MAHEIVAIYSADVYCEDCGKIIAEQRDKHAICYKDDSDSYPQFVMNSEADSPQHCGRCGEFLENPLTTDGYNYVRELLAKGEPSDTVKDWAEFYGIKSEQDGK